MNLLKTQYNFIKDSRSVLLDYCSKISYEDFTKVNDNFGGRSIEFLFLHIINTYKYWLIDFPEQTDSLYINYISKLNLEKIRKLFKEADNIASEFIEKYSTEMNNRIFRTIQNKNISLTATPLQLFTHVTMHEFHHRGQILTMSRMLGYTPIDTDIIRFE